MPSTNIAPGFTPTPIAKDVGARLRQHQAGRASRYTRARRPVTLVWWRELTLLGPMQRLGGVPGPVADVGQQLARRADGAGSQRHFDLPRRRAVQLLAILRRVTEASYPGVSFGPVPTFGGSTRMRSRMSSTARPFTSTIRR